VVAVLAVAGASRRSSAEKTTRKQLALLAVEGAAVEAPPSSYAAAAKASLMPATAAAKWEVHKFGGASLATAGLYRQCSDLLIAESEKPLETAGSCAPTMAIVSAKGGVTDRLIAVVQASRDDMAEAESLLNAVAKEQLEVVRELATDDRYAEVEKRIQADQQDILNVVRAVSLLRTIPPSTMELVTGYGEVWSAMTMHAYLDSQGVTTAWMDAREVLVVEQIGFGLGEKGSSNVVGVDPLWDATQERVVSWFKERGDLLKEDCKKRAPIVIVTGFVASTLEGAPTTLKRSGSDYSATIFARLMGASGITMWKNVNGVYTADPRRVPEAFPIESLKYDEAIELAYFGAQVLHPSAMMPCIEDSIPIYVRNIFNPAHPGTVIQERANTLSETAQAWSQEYASATGSLEKPHCPVELADGEPPIRGISSIDNVAVVSIAGTSAAPEIPGKLFSELAKNQISVLMVAQASADASICIIVEESVAQQALSVLNNAFENELRRGMLTGITVESNHSVVAIVGEGMAFRPGTGATFTKAMANAGVNIRCIAQGSSERQISIVVLKEDCTKALRAAHAALALSNTQLCVAVIGSSGKVGSELLKQMASTERGVVFTDEGTDPSAKRKVLDDLRLDFKVTAVLREGGMRTSYDGLDVSLEDKLYEDADKVQPNDLDELTKFLNEDYNGNHVIVDCSASQEVSDYYAKWMRSGIHVITANKKAGSGGLQRYDECRDAQRSAAQWYYETTGPGSGLPVLTTLKDMTQSGDTVHRVRGTFSGSMSYLLTELDKGVPLSKAVEGASAENLLEPDPREDLEGTDVRRKVVVLARELGQRLEMDDVVCESLLPDPLKDWEPDTSAGAAPLHAQFVEALKPYDEEVAARIKALAKPDHVVVQLSVVDLKDGANKAEVRLEAVPSCHADGVTSFAPRPRTSSENIVEITTARYSPAAGSDSMILRGPGAGAATTASGLFADLLKLSRTLVEWNIPKII
jgi:aspartokinase/homoserine dehydrogenase 1